MDCHPHWLKYFKSIKTPQQFKMFKQHVRITNTFILLDPFPPRPGSLEHCIKYDTDPSFFHGAIYGKFQNENFSNKKIAKSHFRPQKYSTTPEKYCYCDADGDAIQCVL